jgi:hypothetical protein
LSGSIESNIKKGGKINACIFATSQKLTNAKKRELEARAKDLGRPLRQIYDQAPITDLLYRESRWLKELLGITGNPPSLSLFPITSRPLFDVPPIGRDEDIAKITVAKGDVVLIGQPGSGKTHLLFNAAKKARGRFVVSEDLARIANDLRDIQPSFVIVDDAHSRLDFLKKLKHLRKEISADFRIVASCWPGQDEGVAAVIQTAKEQNYLLEGMPPKQIKEVIQSQKIFGPENLVREIIHQSQGKPGLAVTLCRLCWDVGTRDVVLGTALAKDVRQSFEPLLGYDATHLLACFSIGGDAGMTIESAARLLSKNVFDVRRIVEQLAVAGVLDSRPDDRLSVHPVRLRQALVRDIFLKPPVKINLTPYLAEAPDFAAATRVLIEAKIMGGELSDVFLQERLQALALTEEQEAFAEYAYLGHAESEWVLDNFPNKLEAVADNALKNNSEKTVLMILDTASEKHKGTSGDTYARIADRELPKIKHWILSAKSEGDEASRRRKVLADALTKWVVNNNDPLISICASKLVLSLKYEDTSTPAGEPMAMTLHWGIASQNQLKKIFSLWPQILPLLKEADASQGIDVASIFHEWVHPNHPGKGAPTEYENESRGYARQMMTDLLAAYAGKWTFHHHLHNYAEKLGLIAKVKIDPITEVLYPPRDFSDFENEQARRKAGADALAAQLKDKDPKIVADILTTVEEQARKANVSFPSLGRDVCYQIAETTGNPIDWTKALFERGAPAHLLEAFLEKSAASNPTEAEAWISLALDKQPLQWLGVSLVIKHFVPENPIWQKASFLFKECAQAIEGCVMRKEVRKENLRPLLNFSESEVSAKVAAGLWHENRNHEIRDELFEDWKAIVIKHIDEHHEYILEQAFPKYPEIAFEWIAWRLEGIRSDQRPFYFGLRYDRALPAALGVLTKEQRSRLIDLLPESSAVSQLASGLVSGDVELFQRLLSRHECGQIRLSPLQIEKEIGPKWEELAVVAMDNGFSDSDVFNATQGGGGSWSGPFSSMFAAKLAPFEKLCDHANPRLKKVGETGRAYFKPQRDEALQREKRAAVRGELY